MMNFIPLFFITSFVTSDFIKKTAKTSLVCSVFASNVGQNVVIFDKINNICWVKDSNTGMTSRSYQGSFTSDDSNKILLFKVTQGYGQSPFTFYRDVTAFSDIFADWKNDLTIFWYKSSLLKDLSKFSYMIVEVVNELSVVYGWLKFTVTSQNTAESWFNPTSLVDAYPWNVINIKTASFTQFSILGTEQFSSRRTFVIHSWGWGCPNDYGVIIVFEQPDYCGYSTGSVNGFQSFTPPNIGFMNTSAVMGNIQSLVLVKGLRIIGVLKDNYKLLNKV